MSHQGRSLSCAPRKLAALARRRITRAGRCARAALASGGLLSLALLAAPPTSAQDFDGNARGDILWRNGADGRNAIWLLDGGRVIGSGLITTVVDPGWTIAGTGDFDGDRRSDILWRHQVTGQNAIWFMSGLVRTSAGLTVSVTDTAWSVAGVGDFNADGLADILWRHQTTGQNAIWFMNGLTRLSSALIDAVTDLEWRVRGVADFNADRRADILWRHRGTGQNAVWLMSGATRVTSGLLPDVTDLDWSVVGVGDFNADRRADILWREGATGQNAIWLMSGTTRLTSGVLPDVTDLDWSVVGVRDFDGNATADILWRHASSGRNVIWLMNGLTFVTSAALSTVSDLNWSVAGAAPVPGVLQPGDSTTGSWISSGGIDPHASGNPRFTLEILQTADVSILLGANADGSLFLLDQAGGVVDNDEDGANWRDNDNVLHPDDVVSRQLLPGTYTVVAATFAPGVSGDFRLQVESGDVVRVHGIAEDPATDANLAGVRVEVPLDGEGRVATTLADGAFQVLVPRAGLPDHFAVVASAPGRIPTAASVALGPGASASADPLDLEVLSANVAVVEAVPTVHHLGDGVFGAGEIADFQTPVEGASLTVSLTVTAAQKAFAFADLEVRARAVQQPAPVSVNGAPIGDLGLSPGDGSYSLQTLADIPTGSFVEGANTVTIEAASTGGELDDLELTTIVVRFHD